MAQKESGRTFPSKTLKSEHTTVKKLRILLSRWCTHILLGSGLNISPHLDDIHQVPIVRRYIYIYLYKGSFKKVISKPCKSLQYIQEKFSLFTKIFFAKS